MRHKARPHKLNQKPDHARHMQRNLVTSVILYESIRTTRKRARVLQPLVDRLITTAKGKNVANAIRAINTSVSDVNASRKLMEVLSKRYATRTSGFTRVKAVGARKGDGAELVDITLIDAELAKKVEAPKATKAKKPAVKKAPTAKAPEATEAKSSDTAAQ